MSRYFEKQIVRQVLKDALKAGYILEVDGDGETDYRGRNKQKAFDALFNLDDAYLYLFKKENTGGYVGWIRFVFGNDGWDVISDYTVNLEELLKPANKLADEFSE